MSSFRAADITKRHHIEFGVLGPLEVRKSGRVLRLGGPRQRALLAFLLLHANETLSSDRLVDELWGDEPPETAGKMIQNSVSQLRKLLEPESSRDGTSQQVLIRHPLGYELRIEPDELDVKRFERLAEEGRQALAQGDARSASTKLRDALELWRGPALADFAYERFARAEIARLEELRLATTEDRIEADLALGHHADLIGELEALVSKHPYRERLRAHLMLALYRSGRQTEALEAYQKTRELLVEEVGIEPGRALKMLERQILLQDPSLELEPPAPAAERADQAAAVAAAPAESREVRKTVSVVYAELVALGPRLDPEALRRPISRSIATVSRVLEIHGGSVERLLTGAVMAVFGIPAVHEDDPLRAVRAADEIRRALVDLNDELARESRVRLSVRLAVNTGEVVVVEAAAGHGVVAGDATDLAARLEQKAGADEVVISDFTKRLVENSVHVEPLEPLVVEAGQAIPAWKLVDVIAGAPAVALRPDAPLVGREPELTQLRQAFERAVGERAPHLFTILGTAGIGKSRLAAELTSLVEDTATVLTGRCLPYGEGLTFWPVAEIVRQVAGDGALEGIRRLLAGEDDADLIAERVANAIGAVETAAPSEETFWAVRMLFAALARKRPLVVVFDDLHWAQPTLLDLIEHVAEWARDSPILLVCLARPELLEAKPSWAGGKLNATSILLGPLSERESERLVANLVGRARLPSEALASVGEVAEGNPLFLEQMLAMLSERGAADGEVVVPPTIQALLAARLDRLDPDERAVLERASVVGREFWRGAVVDLLPEPARDFVDRHLELLVRRELIRPQRSLFPGDESFRFRHILLREAAYASVPKQSRAALHERFAAWLEHAASERAREFEEIIGHHLEQAYRYRTELAPVDDRARELASLAAERLAAAGRRAHARGDLPAAAGLLSRADALLEAEAPGRTELLVDLSDALRERGELERAEAVLAEAAEAASAAGEPLESHVRIAQLRVQLQTDPATMTEELLREAQDAVRVFERFGDERGLAKAWGLLAWVPWFRCRAAAAEAAWQRAIEHARRAGDSRTEAQSLNQLIGAVWFGPVPVADGIRRCEEILRRPSEQRRVLASASRALAGLQAMEGNFVQARAAMGVCRTILQDLGLEVTAASASETAGIVEMLAGDPVAAERELRAGYGSLEEMGELTLVPVLAASLAQALDAQGRHEEALRFSELSERAATPDDLFAHMQWRAAKAKALARLGDVEQAESLAREAVALAEETDFLVARGDALMDLAEVLFRAGRASEAGPAVSEALRLYEQKGNVVSAERARALLAEPAAPTASGPRH